MQQESPDAFQRLEEFLRLVFADFKRLEFPAVASGVHSLVWRTTDSRRFEAFELSDGTMQLIALACALLEPGRSLVAIDEPEQHLHPDAMLRLLGLAEGATNAHPVLFATQSDTLVGLMDEKPTALAVMKRNGASATLDRPSPEHLREWLKLYGLGELRREVELWGAST